MKEKKYIDYLIFAITAIYTFFGYIKIISQHVNIHFLYMAIMLVLLVLKLSQRDFKIKLSYVDFLWTIYLIFLCINVIIVTDYKINGLQYLLYNLVVFFFYLIIKSSKDFNLKGMKLTYIFSGIHVCFIILQLIFTNFIMKINSLILQTSSYSINAMALNNNYYSGITIQPAAAGFFATIFVAITFIKLITKEDTRKSIYIKLFIGIIALLLTQKRSFLLASLIAIVCIYVFYNPNKNKSKILKILKITSIIIILVVITLICIPETRNVINRFFRKENVLSGREILYGDMLEWFSNNKVCGIGIGTADFNFGYGGHNIYLQTLAETGIIGFILLYLTLIILFFKNIKIATELIPKTENKIHNILLYSLYMQIILFIYGLSGNPIYDYTFFVIFIIAIVLPTVIKRRINNEQES